MLKSLAAALVFFTRLPFWRLKAFNVDAHYYKDAINYWAIVGWLTASVMTGVLWLSAQVFPFSVAIILALLSRLLMTGALHEDGLADFFDGMGGGRTKERILEIMKDSHIGTYGVLSLVFYYLLFYILLSSMSLQLACMTILVADPLSKLISSHIHLVLPYARNEETSKAKIVYKNMDWTTRILATLCGVLPLLILFKPMMWLCISAPLIIFLFLVILLRKKIHGYTGDCCGAMFLLCEISFYLAVVALHPII